MYQVLLFKRCSAATKVGVYMKCWDTEYMYICLGMYVYIHRYIICIKGKIFEKALNVGERPF